MLEIDTETYTKTILAVIDSGLIDLVDVSIDRAKEFVTVATGPTSGIYYPIGGAFATALGNAGYKTSAQATGASVRTST